jgi:hypothetical protein
MKCSTTLKGVVLGLILVFVGHLSGQAQSPAGGDALAANSSARSDAASSSKPHAQDEKWRGQARVYSKALVEANRNIMSKAAGSIYTSFVRYRISLMDLM